MLEVGNINFYNINFFRNRNNYKISFKKNRWENNKLILKTPLLKSPFGIEKYFTKQILNIEFTEKDKKNEVNNFFATLKQIDNFMFRLSWDQELINKLTYIPFSFFADIKDKQYISCIKNRPDKFDPLFRTHIRKARGKQVTEFYKIVDKDRIYISNDDICNSMGKFEIELDFLWITKDTYGLTWYVKNGLIE